VQPSLSAPGATGSTLSTRPWWNVGLLAALVAAVANLLVYLVATTLFGQELLVPGPEGVMTAIGHIPVVLFSVAPAILAALLAAFLARRTAAPRRLFLGIALAVLLLSFLSPFTVDASASTRLTLELMHLVAGVAIVAPLLARLPVNHQAR
jgi:hypothetical protein